MIINLLNPDFKQKFEFFNSHFSKQCTPLINNSKIPSECCMLKLCGESIYKPLNLIFKSCLETGQFLPDEKKTNVVPVFQNVTSSY